MNVTEAIHGRRSIRDYSPAPVERAIIEDVIWDAAQAPSPPVSGETPWAFCVVEGASRLAEYGRRAKEYAREHPPVDEPWTWPDRPDFQVFWNAPVLVLICSGNQHRETLFDCCRAGQNLMLSAYARGLGTCWVGAPIPWLTSHGVAEELGVPPGFTPTVAILLGYPAETPGGNRRARPTVHWY